MAQSYNEADVLVVGAGMGGLTAAIEAASQGARTLLLEKAPDVNRCSTALSGGGFTVRVRPFGPYTPEELVERLIESSDGTCEVPLVETFARRAAPDLQWLLEEIKLPTTNEGSRATPRAVGAGRAIPPHLLRVAQERGVKALFNVKTTRLLIDQTSRVTGVQALTSEGLTDFAAGAVVLATGGFEANGEMLLRYVGPEVHSTAFRHRVGSLSHAGDGQLMAMAAGAAFGNHPFLVHCNSQDMSFHGPGTKAESSGPLRELPNVSHLGIWVNRRGQRFIDESDEVGNISTGGIRQPGGVAALIFDEALRQRFPAEVQVYQEKVPGIFIVGDSLEELAHGSGVIPADRLRATVDEVNAAIKKGRAGELEIPKGVCDAELSHLIQPLETPPFYAVYPVRSCLNTIWGGLCINPQAQVLDRDGLPIAGLYAAGALFGGLFYGCWRQTRDGVWSYASNYEGSLPTCLVFGRIAGHEAARGRDSREPL